MPVVDRVRLLFIQSGRSPMRHFFVWHHLSVLVMSLLASLWLFSCTGMTGTGTPAGASQKQGTASQPLQQASLSSLHWCNKPLMLFRDEGALAASTPLALSPGTSPLPTGTPLTMTSWSQIKPILGFTVFLPGLLPAGSCLMTVYGTVHDPIFGGSFTIAYLLPDHTSLSLSEAPLHSQHTNFQCSLSNQDGSSQGALATPPALRMQLCSGVRDTTNIVFSAQWSTTTLQTFFHSLQSDIEWQPAD